jgi:hypothetical protein
MGEVAVADQSPETTSVRSSTSDTEELQEVTATAQRHKLDWVQLNEPAQKAAALVYGIAPAQHYDGLPPRWVAPVCPSVTDDAGSAIRRHVWQCYGVPRFGSAARRLPRNGEPYPYNTSQTSGVGTSLATPRSNIARLVVRDLVPA